MEFQYKKYRWFFTSSNKLVVGGKSAIQNDELLFYFKNKQDYFVMHTSSPGSSFSVIFSPIKEVTHKDLAETAIFTACFSQAWKKKKKSEMVDLFKISQLSKSSELKQGTWSVKGEIKRYSAPLSLVLSKQKGVFRAIPESCAEGKFYFKLVPGKIDKLSLLPKLGLELDTDFNQEELLSALPAGGISIIKEKK